MKSGKTTLLPPIQDFKNFIEINPTVYQEFIRMFEDMTEEVRAFCSPTELIANISRIYSPTTTTSCCMRSISSFVKPLTTAISDLPCT